MFKWKTTGIQSTYQIASNPSFHSELWAVYPAKHKNTDKAVSVFIFDKKKFESLLTKNNIIKKGDKSIINDAYEVLRAQVSNLAKFRHPNLLTIIEPLEEHKATFLFVTEYLTNCLHSVESLDDVLIQKGLLQTCQGLKFLHEQAKFIHLSIEPTSIFINENSDWKLGGLGHIQPLELEEYFIKQYDPRIPDFININFNYTAPEVILESRISAGSDIYSLGCLIYYLYNHASFINCNDSVNYYKDDYKKFESLLKQNNPRQILKNIPEGLFQIFIQLINRYPEQRLSLDEFMNSEFFNNPLVKTMTFLDEFPTKTDKEKQIFLSNLANLLALFPSSILTQKILPILLDLVKKKEVHLLQVSLNLIFTIGDTLSQLTFHDKIFSNLNKDLLQFEEAQIVILDHLPLLQKKVKSEDFKKFLLAVLEKTLDLKANFLIQSKTMEQIQIILQSVDFPTIKNTIFPQLCTIFSKTTSMTVKVKTIVSFHQLIEQKGIDKFIVNDTLLPLLKSMKTREVKILEAILPVYISSAQILDEEEIVISIIPQLWLLSISSTLNLKAYNDYVQATNAIGGEIQRKHTQKIKALEGDRSYDENEDDKEKFRHLLYGKEDDGKPQKKPSVPLGSNEVLTPSTQHHKQAVSGHTITHSNKKPEPLTLRPKKKSTAPPISLTSNQASSQTLTFGSTGASRDISPPLRNLRNNKTIPSTVDEDEFGEFDEFVSSGPSSRVTSPPPQQAFLSNKNGGIDWSSEANKLNHDHHHQNRNNINNNDSFAKPLTPSNHSSFQTTTNYANYNTNISTTQSQSNLNYPPGFNTNLMMPKTSQTQKQTFAGNDFGSFDANTDSLI